jgi:hypothetical protein
MKDLSMGKRFVPVRNADGRAIDLHLMLEAIREKLPLVGVQIVRDGKLPIIIFDKSAPDKYWDNFSVDGLLSRDVEQAIANGGTFLAFKLSRKKPQKPKLPQTEITRAVDQFLDGREDE